jgi:predicted dithiol-disulfide oxidoreductase (DUF899 family)/uncharacterized protein YndB with AHSA1/START domain
MTEAVGTDPIVRELYIDARPETVFAFFTEPDRLTRWLCDEATVDPRPGGIYHQTHPGDADLRNGPYLMRGEFVEVSPPRRVVFTWGFENPDVAVAPGESIVEVTLEPDGEGTRLRLVHRDLPESERASHEDGWQELLDRLAIAASGGDPLHDKRFPGESEEYRRARDELLAEEIRLRRATEAVAARRRALPPGGAVPEDYAFEEAGDDGAVRRVRLSELFAPGRDTLVVYSFMYGPEMERPCASCTSILDSIDGSAPHLEQRVNLVAVAKSPAERFRAFAAERGWRRLRLLSSHGNTYNRDYLGESAEGDQMPMLNVFVRRDGEIRHFWGSELLYAPVDEGQENRHVDSIWPIWNVLDATPEGRGSGGYPSLSYE